MLDRARPHLTRLTLALIFLIVSGSTILWTIKDKTPPPWDPSDHISQGYDYYRWFAHLDLGGFARDFFSEPHYYAPLVHLVTAVVFVIIGASRLAGIAVNLFSLAALLWSVSWMARHVYSADAGPAESSSSSSKRSLELFVPAILAPLLTVGYHFTAWLVHDAFLDYPLTAITAVTFALLIRANDFVIRRDALAFGVAAGLGMLIKQTFAFFFFLPILCVVLQVLLSRNRKGLANLLIAGGIAVSIAGIWYVPHISEVIEIYQANRLAAVSENEAPMFSLMSNLFYVHGLVSMQTQVFLGVVFAFGLVYSLWRHRTRSWILYLWLISGIGAFTLIANKDLRYTVPVLPAVALLSVSWMGMRRRSRGATEMKSPHQPRRFKPNSFVRVVRVIFICSIAGWSLVSFFNAQWPQPGRGWFIDTPRFRWMMYARNYFDFDHRPLEEDWSIPDIVRTVAALRANKVARPHVTQAEPPVPITAASIEEGTTEGVRPVLGVIVNLPHLNPSSIALSARLMAEGRGAPPVIDVRWVVEESTIDRIALCDYLLVRTGLEQAEWVSAMERRIALLVSTNKDRFKAVASFPIPLEQANAVIYKIERGAPNDGS